MVQIVGKYTHEGNENIDEYFKQLGVPLIARKMLCSSHPSLEIERNGDEWVVTIVTLINRNTNKFKLGEEYEEKTPSGTFKNVTTLEGDKLHTISRGPNDMNVTRTHEFSDHGCVIVYTHIASGVVARGFFKRA